MTAAQDSRALKPCPFCGGEPRTTERPDNRDGTQFFYAVACYCGGYSATAHKMAVRDTPEQAKHDACTAWNRRAALSAEPVAVPQGWKLVPVEPSEEMFVWGMEADCLGRPSVDDDSHVRSIWSAMLAAAPQPAAQESKPLTPDGILEIQEKYVGGPTPSYPLGASDWIEFARAIERSHGITGEPK